MLTFPKIRRALNWEKTRQQRSKRTARPTFEGLEKREVMTVAFNPALGSETVFWRSTAGGAPAGSAITGPVSNPTALQNSPIYLIYSGTSWNTTNANWDTYLTHRILNSSYLSGLTQYGATGTATFGGAVNDNRPTPPGGTSSEISYVLNTLQPGWQRPTAVAPNPNGSNAGNAGYLKSPIYVVIEDHAGDSTSSNTAGVVYVGTTPYLANEITIRNGLDADNYSIQFSRELVDRIVEGTGNGLAMNAPVDVSGRANNADIADNEPEGGRYTAYMKDGMERVQAYWSVIDQKFIIPDGNQQTVTLTPIWNGYWFANQFDVLAVQNSTGVGAPTVEPTNAAKSYIQLGDEYYFFAGTNLRNIRVDALVNISNTGQVWENDGPGTGWKAITDPSLHVTQLVTNGGLVFMRANNQVYEDWYGAIDPLTGPNTNVTKIAAVGYDLFMTANNNGGHTYVWKYTNWGQNWTPITGGGTNVTDIASSKDGLFMLGNNSGSDLLWQYTGTGTNWNPMTHSYEQASQIVSTGSSLYVVTNYKNVPQVWDYFGGSQPWVAITGAATTFTQIIGAGDKLYMLDTNNPSWGNQVWQYNGYGTSWTQITPIGQYVTSLTTYGDALIITIGFGIQGLQYTGKGSNWVQIW